MRERNLTLTPVTDPIDSCTACGKTNYKRVVVGSNSEPGDLLRTSQKGEVERIESNGVQLFKLNANGWCTKFCVECMAATERLMFDAIKSL